MGLENNLETDDVVLEEAKKELAYSKEQLAFAVDKLNEAGDEIAKLNAEINDLRGQLETLRIADEISIRTQHKIRNIEIYFE